MQFRGRPVLAIALVVLFMLYITHSLLNGRARDKVALGDHLIFPGAINASAKDKVKLWNDYDKALTHLPLGPLLLTWFNFNPSMDK